MAQEIKPEDAAVDLVIEFEESGTFVASPIKDPVGNWEIGYGSIWDWRDVPRTRVTEHTAPIDEPTARAWLALELQAAAVTIRDNVQVPLTHNEIASLEDFIYNLGQGNFLSSTLLRLLNRGDREGAANEFAKWNRAGGQVLAGLVRRRAAERGLFDTPDAAAPPPVAIAVSGVSSVSGAIEGTSAGASNGRPANRPTGQQNDGGPFDAPDDAIRDC